MFVNRVSWWVVDEVVISYHEFSSRLVFISFLSADLETSKTPASASTDQSQVFFFGFFNLALPAYMEAN